MLLAGAATATAALAWGTLVEPRRIDWVEEVALLPGLPGAWMGREVALLADLQLGGRWSNRETVRRAIRGLAARGPAIVLIAGDLIEGGRRDVGHQVAEAAELLRPLTDAAIPVFTVLGNHDYLVSSNKQYDEANARHLVEELAGRGVRALENEALPLDPPRSHGADETGERSGEPALYLVGLGPREPFREDWRQAFGALPEDAPRLVLMHYPDSFRELPAGIAPLALAGHTHGGQIRLPFPPRWSLIALLDPDGFYRDGWCSDLGAPGNRLYVNRGLGLSNLPIRIGCPPEVTLFTLGRAGDDEGRVDAAEATR